MVNDRICCGVLKTDLVLRLGPEEAAAALREPHTRPMDFTGKPMKSMIYGSAIGTDSDQALATWVGSAVKLVRILPEKRSALKISLGLLAIIGRDGRTGASFSGQVP